MRKARRPNVLVVTWDTTRADRLGPYGRKNAGTPTLDRLAKRGVVFEECRAAAPITMPSHSTLFTGLYPPRHGVRDNGIFKLPDSVTTLAEHLGQAGYGTGAAIGSFVLSRQFGIAQGFEHFDDRIASEHLDH
ncbi:MAG: sulfatase-like hydrolase/transferase, partial [Myxococcota bacterium]